MIFSLSLSPLSPQLSPGPITNHRLLLPTGKPKPGLFLKGESKPPTLHPHTHPHTLTQEFSFPSRSQSLLLTHHYSTLTHTHTHTHTRILAHMHRGLQGLSAECMGVFV